MIDRGGEGLGMEDRPISCLWGGSLFSKNFLDFDNLVEERNNSFIGRLGVQHMGREGHGLSTKDKGVS